MMTSYTFTMPYDVLVTWSLWLSNTAKHLSIFLAPETCNIWFISTQTNCSIPCNSPSVLHTGKRWFIICPVEEVPTASRDAPSDGTASTHSSGTMTVRSDGVRTTHSADGSIAHPAGGSVASSTFSKGTADSVKGSALSIYRSIHVFSAYTDLSMCFIILYEVIGI